MTRSRQLAAIMFTDIVGYTSMMSKDEDKALEILRKSRNIQQKHIKSYNGTWLKEMGDGALTQFNSAKDAVLCAISIQEEAHNQLEAHIRIGVHLGDVTIENDDIFGDGVNIASRLQSSCDAGGIYISDSVHKAVQADPNIKTSFLGEINYKNVEYPVATYAIQGDIFPVPEKSASTEKTGKNRILYKVVIPLIILIAIGTLYFVIYSPSSSTPIIKSIAVLPFENLTNNEENDIFIAGMHDALISELGRISPLRVISKTSTLRYIDTNLMLPEIANQLDVDAIIETSVLQADSLVSLQSKLIKIFPEEETVWSNSITRQFTHIMEVYRTVTYDIVEEIQVSIMPESRNRLSASVMVDPNAYRSYMNANYYLNSLSKESLEKAVEYFQLSILEDPDFAPTYSGMALVWGYRQQMGLASREEAFPEIEANLDIALSLDGELAECYYSKGVVEAWTNWNWMGAEKAFQEALSINPNMAMAHAFYSHLLMCLKRPIEMKLHMDQAVKIDPYNPLIQILKGIELAFTGQTQEAIEHFEPLDKLVPNNPLVQIGMWISYHLEEDYGMAYQKQKSILDLVSRDETVVQAFEQTFQSAGYIQALKVAADSWITAAGSDFVPPDNIFWLYAAAGDEQKTLEWLEKGYEFHDSNMPYVAVTPLFKNLQDNPRYLGLLGKLNLPK